jgi:hypothetical protein
VFISSSSRTLFLSTLARLTHPLHRRGNAGQRARFERACTGNCRARPRGVAPDGRVTVTVQGDIPDELEHRIVATMTAERREGVRAAVHRHRSREGSVTLVGTNPVGPVQKLMRLRRFGMLRAED